MAAIPPGIDPYTTPAGAPPPGVVPNLANSPTNAYQYYIVAGVCTFLMTALVAVRLWVRLAITRTPWWDDVTILLALGSQMTYTGFVIKGCTLGLGKHVWDVSIAEALLFYTTAAKPSAILTAPAIYFTKLSLLLLYLRIFKPNRLVYTGIVIGIVYCTIYYLIVLFLYIFIADTTALTKLTYSVAIIGVVSDMYILLLPMLAVSRLHLESAKKIRLAGVFLTGFLAVVMSFVGCVYRFSFDIADNTWSLLPIYIVNTVEVDIGIICSCLPLLAALFSGSRKEKWWSTLYRSIRSRLVGSTRGSSSERSTNIRPGHSSYAKQNEPASTENVELVSTGTSNSGGEHWAHAEREAQPGPSSTNNRI